MVAPTNCSLVPALILNSCCLTCHSQLLKLTHMQWQLYSARTSVLQVQAHA
jgi:hypothetical protein